MRVRGMTQQEIDEALHAANLRLNQMRKLISQVEDVTLKGALNGLLNDLPFINLLNLELLNNDKRDELSNKYMGIMNDFLNDANENDSSALIEIDDHFAAILNDVAKLNKKLYDAPTPPERASFNLAAELDKARKLLAKGDPALEFVQVLLATKSARDQVFSSTASAKEFKHDIYKRSIHNMARAIINRDKALFCSINPNELYAGKFSRQDYEQGRTPTLYPVNVNFNEMSSWVAKSIMQTGDINAIAFAADYWINVAYECVNNPVLKDLYGAQAIISALQKTPVHNIFQLAQEHGLVSKKTLERYQNLNRMFSMGGDTITNAILADNPNAIGNVNLVQREITNQVDAGNVGVVRQRVIGFEDRQAAVLHTQFDANSVDSLPTVNMNSLAEVVRSQQETEAALDGIQNDISHKVNDVRVLNQKPERSTAGQLRQIQIKRDETQINHANSTAQPGELFPESKVYPKFELEFHSQTSEANRALMQELAQNNAPAAKKSPVMNLYSAAEALCEGTMNFSNKAIPCLMDAAPLTRAVALAHYLLESQQPEEKLSPAQRETAVKWYDQLRQELPKDEIKRLDDLVNQMRANLQAQRNNAPVIPPKPAPQATAALKAAVYANRKISSDNKKELLDKFDVLIDKLAINDEQKQKIKNQFHDAIGALRSTKLFRNFEQLSRELYPGVAPNPAMLPLTRKPLSEAAQIRIEKDKRYLHDALAVLQNVNAICAASKQPDILKGYNEVAEKFNEAASRITKSIAAPVVPKADIHHQEAIGARAAFKADKRNKPILMADAVNKVWRDVRGNEAMPNTNDFIMTSDEAKSKDNVRAKLDKLPFVVSPSKLPGVFILHFKDSQGRVHANRFAKENNDINQLQAKTVENKNDVATKYADVVNKIKAGVAEPAPERAVAAPVVTATAVTAPVVTAADSAKSYPLPAPQTFLQRVAEGFKNLWSRIKGTPAAVDSKTAHASGAVNEASVLKKLGGSGRNKHEVPLVSDLQSAVEVKSTVQPPSPKTQASEVETDPQPPSPSKRR